MSVGAPRRGLAIVVSLIMFAWGSLTGQPSASAITPVQIGMNIHPHPNDFTRMKLKFDRMAAMNVKWVRVNVDWSAIEAVQGKSNWAYIDEVLDEAAAHGIQVLAVLGSIPHWATARGPGRSSDPEHARPESMSDYGDFVRSVAARFAPRGVHTWEIWNEPNTEQFWPAVPDADEYGALFRVAADAIRGVDARATVLIGGLAPSPPNYGIAPVLYLDELYRNGAAQLADGVAAHPYSYPLLPLDPNGDAVGGFMDLPKLYWVMKRRGDGGKKIWITEFGAPTGTWVGAVSPAKQADILLQARQQVAQWDWAGPLIYYELVDPSNDNEDKEQNFGVLRADLTPKLSALALMGSPG